MQRPLIEERTEALRTKAGSNGRHPMLAPSSRAENRPGIGRAQIISLLWVILFVALIVTALAMVTGTIAMLVRAVMLLFGYQP